MFPSHKYLVFAFINLWKSIYNEFYYSTLRGDKETNYIFLRQLTWDKTRPGTNIPLQAFIIYHYGSLQCYFFLSFLNLIHVHKRTRFSFCLCTLSFIYLAHVLTNIDIYMSRKKSFSKKGRKKWGERFHGLHPKNSSIFLCNTDGIF